MFNFALAKLNPPPARDDAAVFLWEDAVVVIDWRKLIYVVLPCVSKLVTLGRNKGAALRKKQPHRKSSAMLFFYYPP